MTNLPATQQNVWKLATEADKAAALVSLAVLPSRATSSENLDRAAYYLAIEGVTRHGLSEAVKFILRGALGHAFLPSPPELRMQCDKAMEWHAQERERIRRRDLNERERQEYARTANPTPEAKARVAAAYAKFCEGYDKHADEPMKLDPELVAKLPDNPKSIAKARMGNAA